MTTPVSVCSLGVFGDKDEMKLLSVMEGDSVNLNSDSEMEDDDDLIQWSFGNYLIFQINEMADNITVYDDVLEGRFRDRLQVDPQTGSLNITNTRSDHTGFYQLQTNRVKKVFILSVYCEFNKLIFYLLFITALKWI